MLLKLRLWNVCIIFASCLKGRMNADPTPLSVTNKGEVIIQDEGAVYKLINEDWENDVTNERFKVIIWFYIYICYC